MRFNITNESTFSQIESPRPSQKGTLDPSEGPTEGPEGTERVPSAGTSSSSTGCPLPKRATRSQQPFKSTTSAITLEKKLENGEKREENSGKKRKEPEAREQEDRPGEKGIRGLGTPEGSRKTAARKRKRDAAGA
nr:PREDICTED: uncharacterized protein LOC105662553 [Megachile rotundata]